MDMSSNGKNIRKKREAKSWKQEVLASEVNLSAPYIGMIERGEKIPRLETFVKITNALDATSDEILEGVINRGYEIRMNKYIEKIGKLPKEEQNKIFEIMDDMIEQSIKRR